MECGVSGEENVAAKREVRKLHRFGEDSTFASPETAPLHFPHIGFAALADSTTAEELAELTRRWSWCLLVGAAIYLVVMVRALMLINQ